MWSDKDFFKDRNGSTTYANATTWAANKIDGGFDDWRLPTLAELDTAIKHGVLNHVDSTSVLITGYWSSTKGPKQNGSDTHFVENAGWGSYAIPDGSGTGAIAVRGTAVPVTYSSPKVRVYSQDLDIPEGGYSRFFSAVLDTQPSADVSFSITSGDPAQGTVSISSMTFTPANWNLPQKGSVESIDNATLGDGVYYIVLGNAVSTDTDYDPEIGPDRDVPDIRVVNYDNEYAFMFGNDYNNPLGSKTSEAGTTTWVDVSLGVIPTSNGTIDVTLGIDKPAEATLFPTQLVFDETNWNVPQRVTVTGRADGLPDGDQFYQIVASGSSTSSPEYQGATRTNMRFTNIDVNGAVVTYYSSGANNNVKIPDMGTAYSRILVPDTENRRVGDLNVTINIDHAAKGELYVTLIGPDGTRFGLAPGGTTTDDETTFWGSGMADSFDQKPMKGTWTLEVVDRLRPKVGKILNWSLNASLIP